MRKPRVLTDPVAEKAKCLRNAQQFLHASARCAREQVEVSGLPSMLHVPAVVNAAFALELAFKALLLDSLNQGDDAPEGHDLDVLFNKLSPIHQAALRVTVAAPTYPRPKKPSLDPIFDALVEHAKAFVHWRYLHEGQNGDLAANVPFLSNLAAAAIALA